MPRKELTTEWSIEVDDSFASRVVADDLQMVSPGPPIRTIWAATFSPPKQQGAKELVALVKEEAPADPVETFEETGTQTNELRFASWVHEVAEGREQWTLYAYTARRGALAQLALISEDESDLDWALQTWRSLEYLPAD